LTWENLFSFIDLKIHTDDKKLLLNYLLNKTLGYDNNSKLFRAFSNKTFADK
jgi:hypothetical protein